MLSIFARLAEQSLWTALWIFIMVALKAASTVPLCFNKESSRKSS
jgi:hypothetical protein